MRVAFCFILTLLFATAADAAPIEGKRIHVIDGDTIIIDGNRPSFRLVGVNAPDSGERAGCEAENILAPAATARLSELVAGEDLDFERIACSCRPGTEGTKKCNSGRFCGVLRISGVNVGEILERQGLAAKLACGPTTCPKIPRPWCKR